MKNKTFQMRISEEMRKELDELARRYQMSASSVICMLLREKIMEWQKCGKEKTK